MTAYLRAAALTHFEQIATECGLDARALLREVGLPLRCLSEPDLMISASATGQLLALAAERAQEPAFGIRMGASRRLSNLGPLGLVLRDQPTLRAVLGAMVTHVHLHNEAFSFSLVESDDVVYLREETLMEGNAAGRQALELAMTTTFRLLAIFLGEGWRPKRVTFRHAAPANLHWHRRQFGDVLQFGQEFNEIVCHAHDLDVPNPGADPIMARYSQRLLQAEPGSAQRVTDRVRRLVVLLLPLGHCQAEVVAQHLGMGTRTMANHLAREGTRFQLLVDALRKELIASYLADGARSLSDVAPLLGFSELSALSRWYRRQFGVPASRAPGGQRRTP
ncbi:MAG: AraC family transcriptional regulator ligand-binding domain-containing protein [Burkholderiaceae bacterium]|nr:AraC family transcriptional regulator ligand-binding domain-containing protein [Burkholderiaceae bacterium]